MLQKTINSFLYAWNGLRTTWREEHNFRIETFVAVVVIICIFYFQFSFVESALSLFAITLVLTAEIINTAIEDVCNKIEPKYDATIGKIKDTTGAFVLVTVLGSTIVGLIVFYHHFFI